MNYYAVQALFAEWPDALVFLVVAFIIRDRYFAYKGQICVERRSSLPLIIMMSILGIISFLVFVATSAYAGVALSPPQQNSADSVSNFDVILQAFENKLLALVIVQASLYVIGTFALIPLVIFVKSRINSDPILNITIFGIFPILLLRAIGTIVLIAIIAHITINSNASLNGPAFDFGSTMQTGDQILNSRPPRLQIQQLFLQPDTIRHNGFIRRRVDYLNIKLKVPKASDMKNLTILIPKHHKVFCKLKSFIRSSVTQLYLKFVVPGIGKKLKLFL
ncbi:hypothetical protein M422DRAFT_49231 [Sphaerobolus stellatus SS14]|uniref:Uncharacterized protein n=1 Tax=Sphaerobolus stellatus (strain SS14) TaxID=990650 RepID=A0A0C9UAY1_SPHS4|nr:hypothetical protein M422DRAFT_49231 [Sphaerobolus stellatus SS14]